MKRYLYSIILALIATVATAQTECGAVVDSADIVLKLSVWDNPWSGYRISCEPQKPGSGDTMLFRAYHVDESGNKIRQIVTLTDTIAGHPADLNGEYCGGNRIVALTPKEMAALREQGRIWGELWMCCTDRTTKINSKRFRPIELTCWRYPAVSHYAWTLSGEVMTYIDSDGREKMCLAANRELWKAEYTTCDSDGKYDCCLIAVDRDTEREYITKSLIYYEGY